jgi:glutaredoxin
MKKVIVYSQEGCPYCQEIKDLLTQASIPHKSRDIDTYKTEWEKISKHSKNDYVPTILIADKESKKGKVLAPDRDFDDMSECFAQIVQYLTQ